MPESRRADAPIFILGVTQRSGTNYLAHLLRVHPDCAPARMAEDFTVHQLDLLADYAAGVSGQWDPQWPAAKDGEAALRRALGEGIARFLTGEGEGGKRIVAKTPSVRNLSRFFDFFPEVKLIVIVRDGRSVVESGMRGFGWNFEYWTRRWAQAARQIARFEASHATAELGYRRVRYEDLVQRQEETLRSLLEFLNLDLAKFDFAKAAALPVIGSSDLRTEGEIHWKPVERSPEFKPLRRWEGWTRARHERFNRLAGAELKTFGYPPVERTGARPYWAVRNLAADVVWTLREGVKRLTALARRS